jgi:tetratricopeptide (TPR) repeat protein
LPDLSITWVDVSLDRFPDAMPLGVTALPAPDLAQAMALAPRDAEHLILTFSHLLDLEICHRALLHVVSEGSLGMRLYLAIAGFVALAGCSQWRSLRSEDPEVVWKSDRFRQYRAGGLLALQRGDYKTAVTSLRRGADEAEKAGDAISQGRFLANLSTAYLLQRDNRGAIQYLLSAREAAGRGVPVVAITDSPFSPLAQIAGLWIEISEANFEGFRSMAATLTLAMTLTVAIAERRAQPA